MSLQSTRIFKFIYALAIGGTERQFVHTTRELHNRGLKVHAGLMLRKGDFLQDIQSLGIPLLDYPTPSMFSPRTFRQQLRLRRDLRHYEIQILHTYGFYANVFAIPAARLARTPVIIASVRDTGVYLTPMMQQAQKTACRMAHCIVANSYAVRDWLVNDGVNPNSIRVIWNGIVVPNQGRPKELRIRTELGISPDSPVVATVCRVNRSKGLEYLLQAATTVVREMPTVRFVIVGTDGNEPGYQSELETTAAKLGIREHVLFIGQRTDVADILNEVDLSVLPTLSEGLSNVLLEAMAAGLPIVATRVGGNPEVVQHDKTGILIPPKDSVSLSRAICEILRNRDLASRFGQAGRERVVRDFSIQSAIQRTEELYTELLNGRSARPAAA